MAFRSYRFQDIHDRVIQVAADNLQRGRQYTVYTNPGTQHNTRIGNLYPDIILTPLNSNNVQFVIEVETSDTVNANEALTQWKGYSNLGGTFYLLVPQESKILAQNICRQYGIRAKFGTYSIDYLNQLTINYE
jgi:hypothetical protein